MTWVMFDSVDIDQIPDHAQAVAGYVGGHFPTYQHLRGKFPHAHVLSIAVNSTQDAHCLDVEPGDATVPVAAEWVKRQMKRGVHKPVLYASVSTMQHLIWALNAHGIHRHMVRLWAAHFTNHPHICHPSTCGFLHDGTTVDGTQWTDVAHGRNLDESLLHEWFFSPLPGHHRP